MIAGAGSLGLVIGGFLRLAGHEVTLLGRAVHLEAIAARGLHIEGLWGEHRATGFQLAADAGQVRGTFDAILITVKSYDTRAIAAATVAGLAPRGVAVSLQNGLGNVEVIAETVGEGRALGGRVIFGAETVAPGRVRVTVYAEPVLIGALHSGSDAELDAQARLWVGRFAAAGIPAAFCEDIQAALWGKVLYNAALNPLGALLGVHYGALSQSPHPRAIMDSVIEEAFAVAVAEGITLPWASAAEYRSVFYGRLVPATFDHRSSMLQDLERGRPTEIDAINGEIWKRGAAHDMVTKTNELLTRLLHAREAAAQHTTGMTLAITRTSLEAIHAHARAVYPDECCGMIVDRDGVEEVVQVTNIQNELHAQDAEQFPRTAATAYTMGREAAPVLMDVERGELQLRAFYHSHPEHDAYFSAEDRTQAMGGWDEPNYPQAGQIVVSVCGRVVQAVRAFAWDLTRRDFVEVPLAISEPASSG